MDLDFPVQFDRQGRTAAASADDHLKQLIEQVLFTAPGERLNQPTFGSGLLQMVFAPKSTELAAATQFLVQGALQQWLGDLILVETAAVDLGDGTLSVTVQYVVRQTQERQTTTLSRSLA
jgi:phage baseplate assembly protein W